MKVVLLHGPSINSSRQKLLEIKKKFPADNIITFDKEAQEKNVAAVLQTTSLFEGERLVIWENPSENFQFSIFNFQLPITLVFWFDHEVDTAKFKNAQTYFFPEAKEVSVFPFLDLLGQRDKRAYLELDKLRKEYDSQYLITMILYLLRNLMVTPKDAKDFVKNKNIRMRKNFSTDKVVGMYNFVLNTDSKIKSGLMDENQAQFLLVNLFLR